MVTELLYECCDNCPETEVPGTSLRARSFKRRCGGAAEYEIVSGWPNTKTVGVFGDGMNSSVYSAGTLCASAWVRIWP
jgi:hypothetical protein